MKEADFAELAMKIANEILPAKFMGLPKLNLLYQIVVNSQCEFLPWFPSSPKRGQGAFQTDFCICEKITVDKLIPRVAIEYKEGLTTHGAITYSTKALRHKQIYPYLRYGLIIWDEPDIPGRFFTHNEGLDFCVAAGEQIKTIENFLRNFILDEIRISGLLETMAFNNIEAHIYRKEIHIE